MNEQKQRTDRVHAMSIDVEAIRLNPIAIVGQSCCEFLGKFVRAGCRSALAILIRIV